MKVFSYTILLCHPTIFNIVYLSSGPLNDVKYCISALSVGWSTCILKTFLKLNSIFLHAHYNFFSPCTIHFLLELSTVENKAPLITHNTNNNIVRSNVAVQVGDFLFWCYCQKKADKTIKQMISKSQLNSGIVYIVGACLRVYPFNFHVNTAAAKKKWCETFDSCALYFSFKFGITSLQWWNEQMCWD